MASGLQGTATDTLSGMSIQDQYDQLAQALQAAATQQAQQASQAASEAQTQYQQTAAQPPPTLSPADVFVPTLLSNIASVIGQNPSYRENAQKTLSQQRSELIQNRLNNLTALRDNMLQKASLAEKAGDQETALAARLQMDKLDRTQQQLLEQQREAAAASRADTEHQNRLAEIAAQGTQARQTQAAKGGSEPFDISPLITTTAGNLKGQQYQFVDTSGLYGKDLSAAQKAAREQGILAPNRDDIQALKDVDRARRDMQDLQTFAQSLFPKNAAIRNTTLPLLKSQAWLQTNEDRAAYRTWRDTAIPTLRAMAGSKGLRISMQQIQVMIDNLPKQDDTEGTAMRKLRIINTLLDNSEAPIVNRNWRRQGITPPGTVPAAPVTVAAPNGKTYQFPTQAQADAFKKRAGIP